MKLILFLLLLLSACQPAHGQNINDPIIDGSDCSQEWDGIEGRHIGGSVVVDYETNETISRECGHALSIDGWRANVYGNGGDLSGYYVIRDGEKKDLSSLFLIGFHPDPDLDGSFGDWGMFDLHGEFYDLVECGGTLNPADTMIVNDKYAMGVRTKSQQDCGTYIAQKEIQSWDIPEAWTINDKEK